MQPPRTNDASTLQAGTGTRITRTLAGQCVALDNSVWRHPWFVQPYYWHEKKEWCCTVRPGFVNGKCPIVETTAERMKKTPAFMAPVTAMDGTADIAQAARLAGPTGYDKMKPHERVAVPLYQGPLIALPLLELAKAPEVYLPKWVLAIGGGLVGIEQSGDDVPEWFKRRKIEVGGERRVARCDIVLHQPRMALTSSIDINLAGAVIGTSLVTQTLGMRPPAARDKLKVFATPKFQPADMLAGIDPLQNQYEDTPWDELLLATVWLVSPPKAEGEPNASWVPFVRHALFWNLSWWQPPLAPAASDPGTPFLVPLAGGMTQLIIGPVVAQLNDAVNVALNRLRAHSLAGTFWTATGGGSTSLFRETPEAAAKRADGYGLGKDARARAKRRGLPTAESVGADTLDPKFPYTALPFALSLLS